MSTAPPGLSRTSTPRLRSRWPALALATVVGALAGGAATWGVLRAPPRGSPERWIAGVPGLDWKTLTPSQREELGDAAAQSRPLRDALVRSYAAEADEERQAELRILLGNTRAPDVASAAHRLAESSVASERSAGLRLLASLPADARAYAVARRLVGAERDPRILAAAIMNLRPTGPTDEAENREVLAQLLAVGRHPDPLVRAHRIQRLAEWDKGGAVATPEVLDGLSAPEVLVRQASVGAVMIGQLRSPALQAALVALIRRPAEDPVARSSALQALERFPLGSDERAACVTALSELEQEAGDGER